MTHSITIVPSETALIVVDMQNGFCDHAGSMAKGGLNYQPQNAIIPAVRALVNVCRSAGIHVLWSQQKHYPKDVTRVRHRFPTHLQKMGVNVCTKDTRDADLVDALKEIVQPQDEVFEKHRSSCFYNTTLESKLRIQGISTLIVSGVATNYCVESTIRDAYARDFDILVVEEAVASVWEDLHRATLKNVELMYGVVMPLAELTQLLPTQHAPAV